MIDYKAKATSRIIYQYRSAPDFEAWINTLPEVASDKIKPSLDALLNLLDIDAASGFILDIIGEIVGIRRPVVDGAALSDDFFFWKPDGEGWGEGWSSPTYVDGSIQPLPDLHYRMLIKSKIAKNAFDGTIDSIRAAINYISDADCDIDDRQDMSFSVVFQEDISNAARTIFTLFDVVPRPQGVEFLGFSIPVLNDYFGYIGGTRSKPYLVAPYAEKI